MFNGGMEKCLYNIGYQVELADNHYATGEYNIALGVLLSIRLKHANNDEVLYKMALCLQVAGSPVAARSLLSVCLANQPNISEWQQKNTEISAAVLKRYPHLSKKEPSKEGVKGRRKKQLKKIKYIFWNGIRKKPKELLKLGAKAYNNKDYQTAKSIYTSLIKYDNKQAHYWLNLGAAHKALLEFNQSQDCYIQALWLKPMNINALSNWGNLLCEIGEAENALPVMISALALKQNDENILVNFSRVINELGKQPVLAEWACREALKLNSDNISAKINLANALKAQRQLAAAVEIQRDILNRDPQNALTFSNLLLTLQYASGYTADQVAQEHWAFGERFEPELASERKPHTLSVQPDRRLRIGFISGDLIDHAVSYFVEPLWATLERNQFDIIAYQSRKKEDHVSARLKTYTQLWRNIASLTDAAAAQQIRADKIDILIDLAGHTGRNRMLLMARKPAPVQMTWLGHPNTSGLKSIDWRITDPISDPPGVEGRYREKLWYLPDIFCCYRPMIRKPECRVEIAYQVVETPALKNGYITFGCCNNLAKITPPVIKLWSRLLLTVTDARLLIEAKGLDLPEFREMLEKDFSDAGVGSERLILIQRDISMQYLRYKEIDIALDPFPCSGGTTTCDLLWAGVPLITLRGDAFVSRMGEAFLTCIGRSEWVASNENEYVDLALKLSADIPALNQLRLGLQKQVENSPMMDEITYGRLFGRALRGMWQQWCVEQGVVDVINNNSSVVEEKYDLVLIYGVWYPPETLGYLAKEYIRQGNQQSLEVLASEMVIQKATADRALFEVGTYFLRQGDNEKAKKLLEQSLTVKSDRYEAWGNLGICLRRLNAYSEAEQAYHRALELNPDYIAGWGNLANLLRSMNRLEDAEVALRRILEHQQVDHSVYTALGWVLKDRSYRADAIDAFQRAIGLNEADADAWNGLGSSYMENRQFNEAQKALEKAGSLAPHDGMIQNNLGLLNLARNQRQQALEYYRKAVVLNPSVWQAWNNLGSLLQDWGEHQQAEEAFKRALSIVPENNRVWSNYLFLLIYHGGHTADSVAGIHLEYARQFDVPKEQLIENKNIPNPDKKLRIGLISADLWSHAVSYFVEPLLANLDRNQFYLVVYHNHHQADSVTWRMKGYVDQWHDIVGVSDQQVVQSILDDQIDILMDLSGHTAKNRLPVFAKRPAPVQVSWLGHPSTTGLSVMHWRFTDAVCDRSDVVEHRYSERLYRLPEVFCCYRPMIRIPEERDHFDYQVKSTPALKNGYITFGCCNNYSKLIEPMVVIWSQILKSVPNSRLLLESKTFHEKAFCDRVCQRFAKYGISKERLLLYPLDPRKQYLLYHEIDIALDPSPCSGGTTTCDLLWMGVPLITLLGDRFVGRMGASFLKATGHTEWIASDPKQYHSIAVSLAQDIGRLNQIRMELRQEVESSPLMNEPLFSQRVGTAFREMWIDWCQSQKG